MMRDPSSRKRRVAGAIVTTAALVGLLVAAAVLRFTGINWDQRQWTHPDERFIVWVADTISWPAAPATNFGQELRTALDPERSTLNPFRWPAGAGRSTGSKILWPVSRATMPTVTSRFICWCSAHTRRRRWPNGSATPRWPSLPPSSRSTPSAGTWRSIAIWRWWAGRFPRWPTLARCCACSGWRVLRQGAATHWRSQADLQDAKMQRRSKRSYGFVSLRLCVCFRSGAPRLSAPEARPAPGCWPLRCMRLQCCRSNSATMPR